MSFDEVPSQLTEFNATQAQRIDRSTVSAPWEKEMRRQLRRLKANRPSEGCGSHCMFSVSSRSSMWQDDKQECLAAAGRL